MRARSHRALENLEAIGNTLEIKARTRVATVLESGNEVTQDETITPLSS